MCVTRTVMTETLCIVPMLAKIIFCNIDREMGWDSTKFFRCREGPTLWHTFGASGHAGDGSMVGLGDL